jgi:chromosome segregation ATPase
MASGVIDINSKKVTVNGVIDHTRLVNRNLPNQHTISAISGLQDELDAQARKLDSELNKTKQELQATDQQIQSTFTTKQEHIELAEKVTDLQDEATKAHSRLQDRLEMVEAKIANSVESDIEGLDADLTEVASRVTSLEEEATQLASDLEVAERALNTLDSKIDAQIGTVKTETAAALSNLHTNLGSLDEDLSSFEAQVNEQFTELAVSVGEEIDELHGLLQKDIEANSTKITELDSRLVSLSGRTDTVISRVDSLDEQAETINTNLETVKNDLQDTAADFDQRLTALDTGLESLNTTVADNFEIQTQNLTTLETQLRNSLDTKASELNGSIAEIATGLTSLSSAVTSHVNTFGDHVNTTAQTLYDLDDRVDNLGISLDSLSDRTTERCDELSADIDGAKLELAATIQTKYEEVSAQISSEVSNLKIAIGINTGPLESSVLDRVAELETNYAALNSTHADDKDEYIATVMALEAADKAAADVLEARAKQYTDDLAGLQAKDAANEVALQALTADHNTRVAALEASGKATADELAAMKAQYATDLAALEAQDGENKAAIEALTADHNTRVSALEASGKATADELAALQAKHATDLAALIAKGDATQTDLDALEETYAEDLAALQAADTTNAEAIAALETKHDNTTTSLQAQDAANADAIEALREYINQLHPITITVTKGANSTKHFSDSSSIAVNWQTNRYIGATTGMTFDGTDVAPTKTPTNAAEAVTYSTTWTPKFSFAPANDSSVNVKATIANGSLSRGVSCTYTHYVYCGMSARGNSTAEGDTLDITTLSRALSTTGSLDKTEYSLPSPAPSYLYYAVPRQYIYQETQGTITTKTLTADFGIGTTAFKADKASEVELSFGEGQTVTYLLYKITANAQTAAVNVKFTLE